jgi:hypothetical protein
MKCFLIAALIGDRYFRPHSRNARGRSSHGPRIEGYGPSSAIVCDQAGTTCWHSVERYDYPPNANLVIHPYDWQADNGANFAWREHTGRGYWRGDHWEAF